MQSVETEKCYWEHNQFFHNFFSLEVVKLLHTLLLQGIDHVINVPSNDFPRIGEFDEIWSPNNGGDREWWHNHPLITSLNQHHCWSRIDAFSPNIDLPLATSCDSAKTLQKSYKRYGIAPTSMRPLEVPSILSVKSTVSSTMGQNPLQEQQACDSMTSTWSGTIRDVNFDRVSNVSDLWP